MREREERGGYLERDDIIRKRKRERERERHILLDVQKVIASQSL